MTITENERTYKSELTEKVSILYKAGKPFVELRTPSRDAKLYVKYSTRCCTTTSDINVKGNMMIKNMTDSVWLTDIFVANI